MNTDKQAHWSAAFTPLQLAKITNIRTLKRPEGRAPF
jgi:hypothetical protein